MVAPIRSSGLPRRRVRPLVLVVDDFEDGRELYADALAGAGYRVIAAGTGRAAVRLATRQRPALILLDLGLPDIDGGEVARRLRADPRLRRTIIVGLTAFPQGTRRDCEALLDAYLVKPCLPDQIEREVRRRLARRGR